MNNLYKPNVWTFDRKKRHRQWIVDTIFREQKYILKNGKLKKDLCFASLSGSELDEYRWYRDNSPFFTPKQYIAIDRQEINIDRAKEYNIPKNNIYIGEMEHILRAVRVEKNVAIINADFLCTLKTCIDNITPMIRTLRNCENKTKECFLFLNAVRDIMHIKELAKTNTKIGNYICSEFMNDYFPELDYIPITKEVLIYNGSSMDTVMFSFCLHLLK